jgi:nitroreductase
VIAVEFYKVVRTRRSIRDFKQDPVPDDVLGKIFEVVRVAPSGSNRQPWRFILVKDPALRKKVAEACGGQMWMTEAPVIVVGCGSDIKYNRGGWMGDKSVLVDVAIGFTHLILAARAEGLGTCWIGDFDNAKLRELLSIPEDVNVVAISPLGYPEDGRFGKPGMRKTLSEITSVDKY